MATKKETYQTALANAEKRLKQYEIDGDTSKIEGVTKKIEFYEKSAEF